MMTDALFQVRGRDGYEFDRQRIRVEMAGEATPANPTLASADTDTHNSRTGQPKGGKGDRGGKGGGKGRFEWKVVITGLPGGASWQDLKGYSCFRLLSTSPS